MIYRLDLNGKDFEALKKNKELSFLCEKAKIIKQSDKKSKAAATATAARTKIAKQKIENAINFLRLENKEITHYSISKFSKVSFVTVKKYVSNEYLEKLN